MYENNERKIDWLGILKKLLMFVLALTVIFGIIALVTKCTKDEPKDESPIEEKVDLKGLLDEIEEATMKYITKDNLPTELNASKTIKLKYLINKDLIKEVKDEKGNTCNQNSSYSEITKLQNNYALKVSLTCGDTTDYKIVYIGCFESCEDGVCVGDENMTGGICTDKKEDSNKSENIKPSVNNSTNNQTTKPSTTTKPSNSQNNSSSNNSTTTQKPEPKLLYEFVKKEYGYKCLNDNYTLTSDNKCAYYSYVNYTDEPEVIIPAYSYNQTVTKTFKNPIQAKNAGYTNCKISDFGYACSKVEEVDVLAQITCPDKSYSYNPESNKCEKTVRERYYTESIKYVISKSTTWSTEKSLLGWELTGNTKLTY